MLITFKSKIIGQEDKPKKIEFTSELTMSTFNNFNVLEFKEPQDGVQNRIEYKNDEVIIFAGPSTMHLKLNKDIKINYNVPEGIINFISNMNYIKIEKNKIQFKYTLFHNNKKLGDYEIELLIKK